MTISVLLADDHEFFRSGFRAALETQPDLECVADVGDGRPRSSRCCDWLRTSPCWTSGCRI